MATTLLSPAGVVDVYSTDLTGQSVTVPSLLSARFRPYSPPAEIATTLLRPRGGGLPRPQLTTVPLFVSAKPWYAPAAIAATLVKPAAMAVWPKRLSPHPVRVPSSLSARLKLSASDRPAAMAATLLIAW